MAPDGRVRYRATPMRYASSPEPIDDHAHVGVLLVNSGTPASLATADVRDFLKRLLSDPRVIELPRLLWLRIHRTHKAWHVPTMLCKKYRQHGLPRLCDVDVRVEQLPHTTLAMQQFVQEFGTDLAALAPQVLGGKLAYLGLHQMAIADFPSGRASILRSLHYRFSLKYLMLYCASFFLGTRTVIAMIRRIESRALAAA